MATPPRSGPGFGLTLHHGALTIPLKWKEPRLVFLNSMSDLFHEQVPVEFITEVFATMAAASQHTYQVLTKRSQRLAAVSEKLDWPPNVWMGVSIESDRYTFRANHLRTTGAAVRFVSVDPMLGPVPSLSLLGLDWVIAGEESEPSARPMSPDWVRAVRDRCVATSTAFFFKQWGGRTPKAGGRDLDGRTWDEMPLTDA